MTIPCPQTQFGISEATLSRFLAAVRSHYHSTNPYHNFRHVFDVAQTSLLFLTHTRASTFLTPLDKLALIVSAFCHDVDV